MVKKPNYRLQSMSKCNLFICKEIIRCFNYSILILLKFIVTSKYMFSTLVLNEYWFVCKMIYLLTSLAISMAKEMQRQRTEVRAWGREQDLLLLVHSLRCLSSWGWAGLRQEQGIPCRPPSGMAGPHPLLLSSNMSGGCRGSRANETPGSERVCTESQVGKTPGSERACTGNRVAETKPQTPWNKIEWFQAMM